MTGVIVTRPAHQSEAQAAALRARGYTPILAPCLRLEVLEGAALDVSGVAAFACTSANGIAALAARTAERDKPLFVVGAASAAAARAAGFAVVVQSEGDAPALAALIARRLDPALGDLLYASGADAAFDLAAALAPDRIAVRTMALYAMRRVSALPAAALAALDAKTAAAVLLMSARTAEAFGALVEAAGRAAALNRVTALCLSSAVARAAAGFGFAQTRAAKEPTQDALMALLEATVPVL